MCQMVRSRDDVAIESKLNDSFKKTVENFAFLKSRHYEPTWMRQITEIDSYWDQLIRDINIEEFFESFDSINEFQPALYLYNIHSSLHRALTDWRVELMTRVANRIAQFATDEVCGVFVKWDGEKMKFLFDIFAAHEHI